MEKKKQVSGSSEKRLDIPYPLIKPKDKRFVIVNLRTGKTRIPRVGEIGAELLQPYADITAEDGDPILPPSYYARIKKSKKRGD